ncbi:MAG TPA: hypothetical protein VGE74_10670 [Gemmata sp.]
MDEPEEPPEDLLADFLTLAHVLAAGVACIGLSVFVFQHQEWSAGIVLLLLGLFWIGALGYVLVRRTRRIIQYRNALCAKANPK